jgi:predicted transposase/invertase (TIGR01784 family)
VGTVEGRVHKILENMTTERDLKNQFDYARKEVYAIGIEEGRVEGRVEGRAEGRKEGREEGRIEGQIEARLENARNFKHLGVSIDIICQATGLSSEVVEGL